MGLFLFYLHYIIAGILLYLILRCMYIKGDVKNCKHYKTDNDKRLKHPLWLIILYLFVFMIPVVNIIIFTAYLVVQTINFDGRPEYCEYYCKSFLNKEY